MAYRICFKLMALVSFLGISVPVFDCRIDMPTCHFHDIEASATPLLHLHFLDHPRSTPNVAHGHSIWTPESRFFMLALAPPHRVLSRQISRLPFSSSLIPSLNTYNHISNLFATLRIPRRTYAASSARSPSASSPLTGLKWNRRLRRLGIATVVGAGTLWWDEEYNARTLSRNFRTVWHGAAIALDYKYAIFLL